MDVRAFLHFMCIAECQSFSEAAELNHISQSSLSKAIISLEQELDVKLFDRNQHPIVLTPAGGCLYKHLQKIQPLYAQAMGDLHNYSEARVIQCYVVPNSYAIKNALAQFSETHSNIVLKIDAGSDYGTVMDELHEKEYDFVIAHQPLKMCGDIRKTVLYDDEMCVVVSQKHRWASRISVDIMELDNEDFVESPFSRTLLHALSGQYGFSPRKVFPANGFITREEVLQRISLNQGIGLYCSRDISMFRTNNFSTLRLEGVPHIPVVLLESGNHHTLPWHDTLKHYLMENLEHYVGQPAL